MLVVATGVDLGIVGTQLELSLSRPWGGCLRWSFEERLGHEVNGTLPGIA